MAHTPPEIIDVYTHCGLSKYEPIEQVRRVMASAGVQRAVLVQHIGEYDNTYINDLAAAEPERFAGVCMVNHESSQCAQQLVQWKEKGAIKGTRIMTDAFANAPQLFDAASELDLVILLFAPHGIADHVDAVEAFLDRRPQSQLVLTHMGSPDVSDNALMERHGRLLRLAKFPQVYFQISAMKMFCPYPHEALYRLIEQALDAFGAERLCWGSNYPVVGDLRDYQLDLQLLLDGKLPLPDEAMPLVAGSNAKRLWFADSPR